MLEAAPAALLGHRRSLTALRSLVFNVVFYINTIAILVLVTPVYFFLPQAGSMAVVRWWGVSSLWLLRVICGTSVEFRGVSNIPKSGFIASVKHQSLWETFALLPLFRDPAYVIKRELLYVPIWGWWAAKVRMIFVSRGRGPRALRQMAAGAAREAKRGRPIVIYPEGTRRPAGAPPAYRFGIVFLYRQIDVPVVPVALNSGLYWPRRKFLRHPGTVIVEFLPPIAPGLSQEAFMDELVRATESACDRLLLEAASGSTPPPLPPEAEARLAELRTGSPAALAE